MARDHQDSDFSRGKEREKRLGNRATHENSVNLRFADKMNHCWRLALKGPPKANGSCALEQKFLAMQI